MSTAWDKFNNEKIIEKDSPVLDQLEFGYQGQATIKDGVISVR